MNHLRARAAAAALVTLGGSARTEPYPNPQQPTAVDCSAFQPAALPAGSRWGLA